MSDGWVDTESPLTFFTKRNRAFSCSESCEVSRSARTLATSSVLPRSSAATAACDFVQNGHSLSEDVYAAMSSRIPGERGAGSRMIS